MRMLAINLSLTSLVLIPTPLYAASCDIHDYIVRDTAAINQSNETQLAFVLTATESEYNAAKKNGAGGGGYALFSESLGYNNAQERARSIAQATQFDYKNSYARNFLYQNVSPAAAALYLDCIASAEKPGLYLWLDSRQGDYFTFEALWVSSDQKAVVPYDTAPIVDGGRLISKPDAWQSGKPEQMVIKRDGNNDFYLNLKVDNQIKTEIIVKDPATVVWERVPVISQVLMRTGSHGPNPGCSGGEVADCIFPLHPGGALIPDSATLTDRTSSDPSHYNEIYSIKSPNQICVRMIQSTGACENSQTAQGRLTALEEFPHAAQ
jgi:hypothetical protein